MAGVNTLLAHLFLLQLYFGGSKTKKKWINYPSTRPPTRPFIAQPPFVHSGQPLAQRRLEQPPEDGVQFSSEWIICHSAVSLGNRGREPQRAAGLNPNLQRKRLKLAAKSWPRPRHCSSSLMSPPPLPVRFTTCTLTHTHVYSNHWLTVFVHSVEMKIYLFLTNKRMYLTFKKNIQIYVKIFFPFDGFCVFLCRGQVYADCTGE